MSNFIVMRCKMTDAVGCRWLLLQSAYNICASMVWHVVRQRETFACFDYFVAIDGISLCIDDAKCKDISIQQSSNWPLFLPRTFIVIAY